MPRTTSTAVRRFRAWIREEIRRRPGGSRLPIDAELARGFGIAAITVRRELRQLRDRGLIDRAPGRGTYVGATGERPQGPAAYPDTSVQRLTATILAAIGTGQFRAGQPLPPQKTLRLHYGVAERTVRGACRELARRGLLRRCGRSWFVGLATARPPVPAGLRRRYRVALFIASGHDFGSLFRTDFLAQSYQRMSRELFDCGASLEPLSDPGSSAARSADAVAIAGTHEGAVASVKTILESCSHGGARRRPLLVDWEGPGFRSLPGPAVIVNRGNMLTSAARTVMHFLLAGGYRRPLFAFECGVRVWNHFPPLWAILKLRGQMAAIRACAQPRFLVIGPDLDFDAFFGEALRAGAAHPEESLDKVERTPLEALRAETLFHADAARGLAAAMPADILVCASSALAEAAVHWAAAHRIPVPAGLSILCLDDDPRYYHLGLSYCGPDFDRTGYLMAHALLQDLPVERTRLGFLRAPGLAIERLSTAHAQP